jgi:DivIVA domain-containing protein
MNAGTPDETVTAHDVRTAQFTLVKRGGYDTQEVDAFLDQVAETLDIIAETQYRAPARPPVEAAEAPAVAAPAPVPAPVVAPVVEAVPQLHDPDGAAQRLLAAAQRTSDALTAEAKSYAEAQRAEADAYAAATRSDADSHAARVTSTAEAQAATIRETAAEEARRVAEATRSSLINEIERLESDRERLMGDTERIRRTFEADRMRLLDIVDGLRRDINDAGADLPASEPAPAATAGAAAAVAATATPPAPEASPQAEQAAADPVSDQTFEVAVAGGAVTGAVTEPEIPNDNAVVEGGLDDVAAGIVPDEPDERAEPDPVAAPEASDPEARSGTIFDIESDPTWSDDDGPPTEAMPVIEDRGDRFFDELRSSDDSGLGPLDEDTDAALTAFFESDDDDDESWRRRFGGRG